MTVVEARKRMSEALSNREGQKKVLPVLVPALLSLLAALGLSLQGMFAGSPHPIEAPRYLIANRDLVAGDTLQVEDFHSAHLEAPVDSVATDQDLHKVIGSTLTEELGQGEPLRYAALRINLGVKKKESFKIPRGHRAYSVEIDPLLEAHAGDSVDVFGNSQDVFQDPVLIVESAPILRIRGAQAVVAVPRDAVPQLQKAGLQGKLSVALCSREESAKSARLRKRRVHSRKKQIPVWTEET